MRTYFAGVETNTCNGLLDLRKKSKEQITRPALKAIGEFNHYPLNLKQFTGNNYLHCNTDRTGFRSVKNVINTKELCNIKIPTIP